MGSLPGVGESTRLPGEEVHDPAEVGLVAIGRIDLKQGAGQRQWLASAVLESDHQLLACFDIDVNPMPSSSFGALPISGQDNGIGNHAVNLANIRQGSQRIEIG